MVVRRPTYSGPLSETSDKKIRLKQKHNRIKMNIIFLSKKSVAKPDMEEPGPRGPGRPPLVFWALVLASAITFYDRPASNAQKFIAPPKRQFLEKTKSTP